MNPFDMRDDEEKYIDSLIAQHEDGEHEHFRVRDCPDCNVEVES